jgi:hypothetical protein
MDLYLKRLSITNRLCYEPKPDWVSRRKSLDALGPSGFPEKPIFQNAAQTHFTGRLGSAHRAVAAASADSIGALGRERSK